MEETGTLERPEDAGPGKQGIVKRWLLELKLADKREAEWRKKGEAVLQRYRQQKAKRHSFNILWSNTETLRPAIYNSLPKPDVRRRFKDEDKLGKVASEVLSRSIEYGMDTTDFDTQVKNCVIDMLLPGRGVARVRYVPSLVPTGETVEAEDQEALEGEVEELAWEQAPIEHVNWEDFRMGEGKEWSCVTWIAFRHCLTKDELVEKFGAIGEEIPMDKAADNEVDTEQDEGVKELFKTAVVWEIWDKEESQVLFIAPGYKKEPLKTLDDPLKLTGFFPIPKPLYAAEDASSLIPIPLFEYYKEQADELDVVTRRINILVKGLKMRGIYDSTLSELSELMRGEDNDLIPASNVTALLERGGLEKAIWFMPIEQSAKVLQILQLQREATKQVIYEITGISDIVRGATNANETATAQQIKSQWGNARLKRMQTDCAVFIRDLIRLQSEIIGEQFQPETLAAMTGLKLPTGQEKQQAMAQWQMQAQQAQAQGQPAPLQPDLPPSWDEVIQVLRDDKMRTFKIDIETDSTVAASMESDMSGLRDVLTALTQVMQGFGPAVQMGAMPVEALKEIMLTITRRAKMGNAVEDAFDKIKQPPPPQPEPQPQDNTLQVKQMELQHEQQIGGQNAQLKQAEMQQNASLEMAKMQHTERLAEIEAAARERIEQFKFNAQAEIQWRIAQLDNETKLAVASMGAEQKTRSDLMALQQNQQAKMAEDESKAQEKSQTEAKGQEMGQVLATAMQGFSAAIESLQRPKMIIRGPDGKAQGIQ